MWGKGIGRRGRLSAMRYAAGGLAAFVAWIPAPAMAQNWFTTVQDDVITDGKTATMVGMSSLQNGLYFACGSDGNLSIAFIEKGEFTDGLELIPAKLILRVDDRAKHNFDVRAYLHNAEYYGFRADDESGAIAAVLAEVEEARRPIAIGLVAEMVGIKWTGTISPAGSTSAARRFRDACGL
jgi:hypothetical protein